jgi:phage terminase large subunit
MITPRYVIRQGDGAGGPVLRGGALELWRYRGPEVILAGPSETGKTTACLHKLNALLWKYPGAQAVLVRKVRDTIYSTVLQTYQRKILKDGDGVTAYGGEHPSWYDYPGGSRLWLAGMDRPDKALSSERDFVYVNQAEELDADDWQVLTTRATGRAGGAPYGQVMGDANPGPPWHWIKQRATLRLLESRHADNPLLYDDGGNLTEQGRRTMAVLDALTGVRRERLRDGRWVAAEGTVYEWDAARHVVNALPAGWRGWPKARAIDFGFTNPFVCLWGALDPDGVLYVYREWYMSRRTVAEHAPRLATLSAGEVYEATVADHDREDRETLHRQGVWTLPADKAVSPGIQAVERRLAQGRLFVLRDCLVERDEALAAERKPVCLAQEMDVYQWPKAADGRPVKEAPVDRDNHACDALRYLVRWADARAGCDPSKIVSGGRMRLPPGVFGAAGRAGGADARRMPDRW